MGAGLFAVGVGLFKAAVSYFGAKKKAKEQAALQGIAQHNQQLQQYWKLHDFDSVSGITTSAQAPSYSGDKLDYSQNARGFITSSSGSVGIDSTAALPVSTADMAANAIAGGVSSGLNMYSAVSSYKSSKASKAPSASKP